MNQFRAGQFAALICKNVAARIDIRGIDIVINYDIPIMISENGYMKPDYDNYLRRVGRTGRCNTDGIAITFY
jgi:ATP-dependent RNA helicase DDX19/DBP5